MRRLVATALLSATVACGPSSGSLRTPEYRPEGQTSSHAGASSLRPLVIDWPSTDRAALEARRGQGIVVVRYAQTEMTVLPACTAAATYRFRPVTPKLEGVVIRDGEELNAALPLHSVGLEGRLARRESLDVKLAVVGMYASEPRTWRSEDLSGDCTGATHVVSSLAVGAFEIAASAESSVSGGAKGFGASVGVSKEASREVVRRDGRPEACAQAGGSAPAADCRAPLRVELVPLTVPLQAGACAANDVECLSAKAQGGCGAGFVRNGNTCEAANPERPSLVEGLGGRR